MAHLARQYQHHVRVGAANAGHTFYVQHGVDGGEIGAAGDGWEKHVVQQLPVAAYANPTAKLYIGPGALISPDILEAELWSADQWRKDRGLPELQVGVDYRAHVIIKAQREEEARSRLAERIGSTSATAREGIGQAQADRVLRAERCVRAVDWGRWTGGVQMADVPWELAQVAKEDDGILLEGTQGYGLSLTTGAHPFVTSRNTTSAGLCADVGLSPRRLDRVVVVLRTFPIRVAGNSGPFHWDSKEIEDGWSGIGVDPEQERTTVTRKVRRVATFSQDQARSACQINGATGVALMHGDYLTPGLRGVSGVVPLVGALEEMVRQIEQWAPVTMVGTGPHSMIERSPLERLFASDKQWL